MMLEEQKGKIDCWNIQMWLEDEQSFDGGRITVKGDYAIDPSIALRFEPFDLEQPDLQTEGYQRIKAWHEMMTLVNQRAFYKEVFMWTRLCKENNAKLKIFAINNITWLPKDLNMFGDCSYATVADQTVEQFLKTLQKDQCLIDDEHYDVETHKLIAEQYIPQIGKEK